MAPPHALHKSSSSSGSRVLQLPTAAAAALFQWPPAPPPPPPPAPAPALAARPLPSFHATTTTALTAGSFPIPPAAAAAAAAASSAYREPSPRAAKPPPSAIPNYGSSGSQHDPNSLCLHAMVHNFLEEEEEEEDDDDHKEEEAAASHTSRCNACPHGEDDDDGERCSILHHQHHGNGIPHDSDTSSLAHQLQGILEDVACCSISRKLESHIVTDATRALEEMEMQYSKGGTSTSNCGILGRSDVIGVIDGRVRRSVMKLLRQYGHNAAICKSRWSHRGGLPAGDYEYIDIITSMDANSKTDRYIVDMDFKAQFEIARASQQYKELMAALPQIFVGRPEQLREIVKMMCASAKWSLKQQGLHMPPWRKQRYMLCKWFASYRRTTAPASSHITPKSSEEDLLGLGVGFVHAQADLQPVLVTQEMDLSFFKAQAQVRAAARIHCAAAAAAAAAAGAAVRRGFDRDPRTGVEEAVSCGSHRKMPPRSSALSVALKSYYMQNNNQGSVLLVSSS